jgi:hypothetical protein
MSNMPNRLWAGQPEVIEGMGLWQASPEPTMLEYVKVQQPDVRSIGDKPTITEATAILATISGHGAAVPGEIILKWMDFLAAMQPTREDATAAHERWFAAEYPGTWTAHQNSDSASSMIFHQSQQAWRAAWKRV